MDMRPPAEELPTASFLFEVPNPKVQDLQTASCILHTASFFLKAPNPKDQALPPNIIKNIPLLLYIV